MFSLFPSLFPSFVFVLPCFMLLFSPLNCYDVIVVRSFLLIQPFLALTTYCRSHDLLIAFEVVKMKYQSSPSATPLQRPGHLTSLRTEDRSQQQEPRIKKQEPETKDPEPRANKQTTCNNDQLGTKAWKPQTKKKGPRTNTSLNVQASHQKKLWNRPEPLS